MLRCVFGACTFVTRGCIPVHMYSKQHPINSFSHSLNIVTVAINHGAVQCNYCRDGNIANLRENVMCHCLYSRKLLLLLLMMLLLLLMVV